MAEYLRLVADGRIECRAADRRVFPVDEAAAAYAALKVTPSDVP